MTDGAEKNEPSASKDPSNSRTGDNSIPKGVLPDEEGPGQVGVALSWTKSRIRNLDTDKTISREERDLLCLYYTREQEKLQLKLRVFGEAEKVKGLESAIRSDGEVLVQKAESERYLAEEALVKARSEQQRAFTELECLCRDDASWEKQGTAARRWQESRKWQAITPDELQPAVEAIRHKIEHYGLWQSSQSTMKLCFSALHPGPNMNSGLDSEDLAPYKRFLVGFLGQPIEKLLLGSDRPVPLIFKSYLDALETATKTVIRAGFQEMFEIAKARNDLLGMHPVEWTKRELDILISAEKSRIRTWIKQVCDPMHSSTTASRDDSIFWGNWRAPRLIHMQPAGNTRYDQATSWTREELVKSEELLEARAELTIDFLRLDLDELARVAHIDFVKSNAAKPLGAPPGEIVRKAAPLPYGPAFARPLAPDVWHNLHDRFKALADEELTLAPQHSGTRWLRAYADYKDKTKASGQWDLSNSIHENFRERFEVESQEVLTQYAHHPRSTVSRACRWHRRDRRRPGLSLSFQSKLQTTFR
jgi:hypothetical protein